MLRITGLRNGRQIAWFVTLRKKLVDSNSCLSLNVTGFSKEIHSRVPAFLNFRVKEKRYLTVQIMVGILVP